MGDRRAGEAAPRYDVLVVGAGQAGLATGYHLRRLGLRFLLLDAGAEVGSSWASRWESLQLFTPARYSRLPGTPFPAPPDARPGKDQVAGYFGGYARRHELPVRLRTRVEHVARDGHGYALRAGTEHFRAQQVVLATGAFQAPFVPPLAGGFGPDVAQLHSSTYRRPDALPGGPALVVGGGASGRQIARELAGTRPTTLAVGRRNATLPRRVLGRDLYWWLDATGLMRVPADSRLGRRMRQGDGAVVGTSLRELRRAGVRLRPRLVAASQDTARFADGSSARVRAVVWATGYRPDSSWLDVPEAKDDAGRLLHRGGVTPAPGLYVVGLPWLRTTGSALLGFVERDAAFLAEQIAVRSRATAP